MVGFITMEKENKKTGTEEVQKVYIYLVKTPQTNDVTVCASDGKYYPGTYVVAPTRYGLDMGVIVGNAPDYGTSQYTPGCTEVRGSCHFAHCSCCKTDAEPAAAGQPDDFSFQPYRGEISVKEEPIDETGIWDSEYPEPRLMEVDGDVTWISHMATPDEIKKYNENLEEEKKAIEICREKIQKNNLDMKLVTSHFLLCEPKVLFFFTSEGRVDFRDLVKDLVAVFKMRIELRQIGVRDESRVLGGLAVCGRDYCCHCVSDKLDPVTIKMAKEQNLSLNSIKISGPCGRLLCCLSYEYEFYNEEKSTYPQEGTKIKIGDELFRVQEVNILSRKVTLSGPEGALMVIPRAKLIWSDKNDRWEVNKDFVHDLLSN